MKMKIKLIQIKQYLKKLYDSQSFWIKAGVIGIWCIVAIKVGEKVNTENGATPVYIVGGEVDVSGSVGVANTVDVNLNEVLGYSVGCRKSYTIDGREYQAIDVCNRY